MSYTYTDKIKFAYTPNFDAFGRLRTSQPLTLFDSSHRFSDNGLWNTYATGSGTYSFNSNAGLINLDISTSAGDEVIRETKRVFAYQPGKSLLILNTFVLAGLQNNLRQRIGYFNYYNGFYLETLDTDVYLTKRSYTKGSIDETATIQGSWNVDNMDGNGPSGITINFSMAQILWIDMEWLGVGSVRMGFVINGEFYTCHVFHHANLIPVTYTTTACLPIRYEISSLGTLSGSVILRQICSSVMSEGGYEIRGQGFTINTPITSAYSMAVAGTYYPIISIRLKSTRLDGIAVIRGLSIMPDSAGYYHYKLVSGGVTTGGTWSSVSGSSIVEYNINGTSFTGGNDLMSGFLKETNQSSTSLSLQDDIFRFQLERNSFTNTAQEFTLCITSNGSTDTIFAAMDWEEITR